MSRIILASQSPRRKELLANMGVQFDVMPSNFDEQLDDARTPAEVAVELALGKAMTIAKQYPDDIIIGADTIVTVDGTQLAKAADEADARRMLQLLAGKVHDVTTGLAVIKLSEGVKLTIADNTKVSFKPYDQKLVDDYLASGDYKDKAAAYGIQSGAAPLIEYFAGDYDTIMGLPTKLLAGFLAQVGISAKPVELQASVERRDL